MKAAHNFASLQDFLDIYAACNVLPSREDFRDLTIAYFEKAARDNVRHVELFFDPHTHTTRGVSMGTMIENRRRHDDRSPATRSARNLIPNFPALSARDAPRCV